MEARRSLEYLHYIRETKMVSPLISAIKLHSLLSERKKYYIIYNEFFIYQAIKDLIIIYKTLGATFLVQKLQKELLKYEQIIRKYRYHSSNSFE